MCQSALTCVCVCVCGYLPSKVRLQHQSLLNSLHPGLFHYLSSLTDCVAPQMHGGHLYSNSQQKSCLWCWRVISCLGEVTVECEAYRPLQSRSLYLGLNSHPSTRLCLKLSGILWLKPYCHVLVCVFVCVTV